MPPAPHFRHLASRTGLLLLLFAALGASPLPAQNSTPASTDTFTLANPAEDFVAPVTLPDLIQKPANLFNLVGKTVRFTPQPGGTYTVEILDSEHLFPCEHLLADDTAVVDPIFGARGWLQPLDFDFPFGGKQWRHIYVNRNGNLSFEKNEGAYWPDRDPWPDAGMRSMAAAIDGRTAAGLEQMIAVLWAPYEPDQRVSQVRVHSDKDFLAVTWTLLRNSAGQAIAGPCSFQVRIYSSGMVEMTYLAVPERDGIVGLFPGTPVNGPLLSHWQATKAAANPSTALNAADIYDDGSVLKFVFHLQNPARTHVPTGTLVYRCLAWIHGYLEQFSVAVTDHPSGSSSLGASPQTAGWRISGNTVELYLSKVSLAGVTQFSPNWNVVWWGQPGDSGSEGNLTPIDLTKTAPGEIHLTDAPGPHFGNIFEVFHYAAVTKDSVRLLKAIYQSHPAGDDMAYVFTDFRLDDLFGQGRGAQHLNVPIQGIGGDADKPISTRDSLGSTKLQIAIATVWVGSPLFAESGNVNGQPWFHYARAMQWLAHESTHHWGMMLVTRDPRTGQEVKLTSDVGHWLEGLNAPSAVALGSRYLDKPVTGPSIMGGSVWKENSDGTYSKSTYPFGIPGGYSALDLYVLGIIPPEKAPETFLLANLQDLGGNRFSGTKVRVRIQDIVSVEGPRVPSSEDAQKTFFMKIYLLHEPGRDVDPRMLARTQALGTELAEFFKLATKGNMQVLPSGQ